MGHNSKKRIFLNRLEVLIEAVAKHANVLRHYGMDSDHVEDMFLHLLQVKRKVSSQRHLHRGTYSKRKKKFQLYLTSDHDDELTEDESQFNIRMDRDAFD